MNVPFVKANYRPVAWRVKDAAGEWVVFADLVKANSYKAQTGREMQPVYVGRALIERPAADRCDCGAYCDECNCRAVR